MDLKERTVFLKEQGFMLDMREECSVHQSHSSFDWMESFQLYSSNTEPQFITFEVEQRNTSLSGGSQPISYFMIKASIFGVLIILTLCGNSLVLFACITNKNLQQPCNYFLASLACADLGVGVLVMIPRALYELVGHWPLGLFLCQLHTAFDVTCCTCSILHLCGVSIDRYYAIVKEPLLYQTRATLLRTGLMITLAWLLGILIGFASVFTGIYTTEFAKDAMVENPKRCEFEPNHVYGVVAGVISFWFPAIVMVYVYIRVYMEAVKLESLQGTGLPGLNNLLIAQETLGSVVVVSCTSPPVVHTQVTGRRRVSTTVTNQRESSGSSRGSMVVVSASGTSSADHGDTRDRDVRETRAALSLGFLMGAFLVCWMPFFIWMPLVTVMKLPTPPQLYIYILWIGFTNSAINPLIYAFHHQDFKDVFTGYLTTLKNWILCKNLRRQSDDVVET